MFNKINQEINTEIYREEVIEVVCPNIHKGNRDMEINIIITPSKNYFKAMPYGNNNEREIVFEKLSEARAYLESLSKTTKRKKG